MRRLRVVHTRRSRLVQYSPVNDTVFSPNLQYPDLGSFDCNQLARDRDHKILQPFSILTSDRGTATSPTNRTSQRLATFSILTSDRGTATFVDRNSQIKPRKLSVS